MMMRVSQNCIELIRASEGFSARPYRCPAGIPTIGYGSTRYGDGTPVKLIDQPVDEEIAAGILSETLSEYEAAVCHYVTAPLNQNQFDALVDFAYNAGAQSLRTSTLLKKLNAGDYVGAANEFCKWIYGGGKPLPGLVIRRANERKLFEKEA